MIFGDKSKFAVEIDFKDDPNNDQWAGWDEVGTYGHFDLFINDNSMFKARFFHMEDADTFAGYRILKTYDEYDDGRDDHLLPIFRWFEEVYYVVTRKSKTRFERCNLTRSWHGNDGNIYPSIIIKQHGKHVTISKEPCRSTFFFNSHVAYPASGKITLDSAEFIKIMKDILEWIYSQECITTNPWFKDSWHPKMS